MNVKFSPAVTETKVVEVKPAGYTVELSQDELDLLVTLTGSVVQDGDDQSIRKMSSEMYYKLLAHRKVDFDFTHKYKGYRTSGAVRFVKQTY